MLNIISRAAERKRLCGPFKVFSNLAKGLAKIKYPYVINRRLDSCRNLWIHDDTRALPIIGKLPPEIKVIIGPNLYVMPRDIPNGLDLHRTIYLQPSEWAARIWEDQGFNLCPIRVWPVGIDTDTFIPTELQSRDRVLIYHKQRDPNELEVIVSAVQKSGLTYSTISYGTYTQNQYLRELSRAKYIIWHGRHESQGIAFQEAMSCNVPVLLWDATSLKQWSRNGKSYYFTEAEQTFPVTSAPYFNDTCGLRIETSAELNKSIIQMESSWRQFEPRNFVLQNLSLEKQAKKLISYYEPVDIIEGSKLENIDIKFGKWRPPLIWILHALRQRIEKHF